MASWYRGGAVVPGMPEQRAQQADVKEVQVAMPEQTVQRADMEGVQVC